MKLLEPFHALMRRLMPFDPDTVVKPGAFGLYFTGPLWWAIQLAYEYHDKIDSRIRAGLTTMTHEENDAKFKEAVHNLIEMFRADLTPAQYAWAHMANEDGAWLMIRLVRELRGEV